MEQPTSSTLFSLSIDPVTKAHLYEAARWAKFLAVVGMIFMGLMLAFVIFASSMLPAAMGGIDPDYGAQATPLAGFSGIFFIVYFVVIALIYFFPLWFTLKFANQMKTALNGNDQEALNASFLNLKKCYRFLGILTIIGLAIFALAFVFGIIGAASFM